MTPEAPGGGAYVGDPGVDGACGDAADDAAGDAALGQSRFVDGLAQGYSIPEAAALCGLPPQYGTRLLEQPEIRDAVRRSHAALASLVHRMDLEALLAQPADSNVVSLWAWYALRGAERP